MTSYFHMLSFHPSFISLQFHFNNLNFIEMLRVFWSHHFIDLLLIGHWLLALQLQIQQQKRSTHSTDSHTSWRTQVFTTTTT